MNGECANASRKLVRRSDSPKMSLFKNKTTQTNKVFCPATDLRPVWASGCPHRGRPGLCGPSIQGQKRPWGAAGSSGVDRAAVSPGPPAGCRARSQGRCQHGKHEHSSCYSLTSNSHNNITQTMYGFLRSNILRENPALPHTFLLHVRVSEEMSCENVLLPHVFS